MATRLLAGSMLIGALAAAPLMAQSSTVSAVWPEFVKFYHERLTHHAVVGSSAALISNGRIVAREHAGFRDREAKLPIDSDTIFHWASITKTFTAIGIMQLRDRGLLRLEDPIVKYVPELRKISNPFGPVDGITLKHLLSHSAGFRASTWPWGTGDEWQPFEPPGWEQLIGMMPYTRIEFAPGSKFSYSNPGFIFLGRVIEDVMGEPFETYIDKEILRPLGMTRAFFDRAPSMLRADRSHSYFVTDDGLKEARFDFDTGITVANGGLNAPIDDMARYLAFLSGDADSSKQARYDAVLKRSSLEQMWKPVVPVSSGAQMGLSFFLEQHGPVNLIAHSGGQNGFISHFFLDPASRTAYIVAFNTQTTSAKEGTRRNSRALDDEIRDWMIQRVFTEQRRF